MNLDRLTLLATGFASLMLMPTLGLLGLMKKKAIPVLAWTLAAWTAVGAFALYSHTTLTWSESRFLHAWLIGLGLGATFLLIAWLRNDPRIGPWVKFVLALVSLAVFVRQLLKFLEHYA